MNCYQPHLTDEETETSEVKVVQLVSSRVRTDDFGACSLNPTHFCTALIKHGARQNSPTSTKEQSPWFRRLGGMRRLTVLD